MWAVGSQAPAAFKGSERRNKQLRGEPSRLRRPLLDAGLEPSGWERRNEATRSPGAAGTSKYSPCSTRDNELISSGNLMEGSGFPSFQWRSIFPINPSRRSVFEFQEPPRTSSFPSRYGRQRAAEGSCTWSRLLNATSVVIQ